MLIKTKAPRCREACQTNWRDRNFRMSLLCHDFSPLAIVVIFGYNYKRRRCLMAQTATATRFKHGSESFPILFEDGRVRVYKNPTNEIFVEDIMSGVTMRINYSHDGGLQFTADGRVEPIHINGMIGWRVSPR